MDKSEIHAKKDLTLLFKYFVTQFTKIHTARICKLMHLYIFVLFYQTFVIVL